MINPIFPKRPSWPYGHWFVKVRKIRRPNKYISTDEDNKGIIYHETIQAWTREFRFTCTSRECHSLGLFNRSIEDCQVLEAAGCSICCILVKYALGIPSRHVHEKGTALQKMLPLRFKWFGKSNDRI